MSNSDLKTQVKSKRRVAAPRTTVSDTGEFDPEIVRPKIQHLLDAGDPDVNDPAFPLLVQYEKWQEAEERKQSHYRSSLKADAGVPIQEAQRMFDLGRLEAESTDYMLVHTKEALRLFIGRRASPDGDQARIPGAKSVGAALRTLWVASSKDNPYADWALLMAEQTLDERMKALVEARVKAVGKLQALEQMGLHISLLHSKNPVQLDLAFKSPYGFLVAQLVGTFDHYVRAIKTLQARDLLGADETRAELRSAQRPLRGAFDAILRHQALLMRPAFGGLSRTDFASKSADVQRRVAELAEAWPGLPEPVLRGELVPRHGRRAKARPGPVKDGLL